MGVGVAIMADEEGVGTLGISSMRIISLTLFRLGEGGGLFEPPPPSGKIVITATPKEL